MYQLQLRFPIQTEYCMAYTAVSIFSIAFFFSTLKTVCMFQKWPYMDKTMEELTSL